MNDEATLTALRNRLAGAGNSLGDVHMTVPVSEIFARAKKRRVRRGAAVVAAACAAIGIPLAVTLPPGGQARAVHVHLAAWSVDTNPNGTVTFRLRNTSQPERLQHVLGEAGVPAMVRWGRICLAEGRHVLLPTTGIVSYVNGRRSPLESVFEIIKTPGAGNRLLHWSWTITPSKIPSSARFVISAMPGDRVAPGDIQAAWEFVPASAPVRCATSVR